MTVDELKELLGKVTSGPWCVDPDPREGMEWNRHIIDYDFNRVCFMAHNGGHKPETDEANAALIAISPQIAAALIEAIEGLRKLDYWHDTDTEILTDMSAEVLDDHNYVHGKIRDTLSRIDAIMEAVK